MRRRQIRQRARGEVGLAVADGLREREHAKTRPANRFFPDGYAVYDWETKGFTRKGMMGQQVFETLEEAERVAGPEQIVVRLARPRDETEGMALPLSAESEPWPPGPDRPPSTGTESPPKRSELNDREFAIVVPKTDNSGNDIKPEQIEDIATRMSDRFGGVTVHPSVVGCWLPDEDDPELMCEENAIITAIRDSEDGVWYRNDQKWMDELADDVGERFGQAAVLTTEDVTESTFVPGELKDELPGEMIGRDVFSDVL